MHSILAVDDEKTIRTMFLDYFEDTYEVDAAANASEALEKIRSRAFDLVLSDINMPGMSGPELLAEVSKIRPGTKTVLMTAYNVDDYVRMAKDLRISSIIPKTVPFNYDEVAILLDGLLNERIFGLERYMLPDVRIVETYTITSSEQGRDVREAISDAVEQRFGSSGDVKLIMDELITNAIYHAPRNKDGSAKYEEYAPVTLGDKEHVYVTWGYDSEKYGISIVDVQGKLTKDRVLYKIDRHIRGEGMLDDSGRGIHMSRLFADRLVINIKPGQKTEVIIMNYFTEKYRGYRPLYINEL